MADQGVDDRPLILVVEDEHDLAALVRLNLEIRGYEVTVAHDGSQGLEAARAQRPDLVLLDIMMPVLSGWEVLRELKEDDSLREIPVIMLTALSAEREVIRGHLEGAVRYITKPFEVKVLVATVEDALDESDPEAQREQAQRIRTLLQRLAELDAGRIASGPTVKLTRLESVPNIDPPQPAPTEAELGRLDRLTDKQRTVAAALACGDSARELATKLGVSRSNVYATRKRIARKLGVPADRVAAEAARLGLTDEDAV